MRPLPRFSLSSHRVITLAFAGLLLAGLTGCPANSPIASTFVDPFVEELIQARTFIDGQAVTTAVYLDAGDGLGRRPFGIDFNDDGKIDPVVGYGGDQAVIQILLSQQEKGVVDYFSLTLDSKRDMENLADVAVGDIDGDGRLDIVAGANEAIWYFRQPEQGPYYLRGWGNPDETDALRERIESSAFAVDEENIEALIKAALGASIRLEDYVVKITTIYTDVEIGDFDNDGWQDIAGSRFFQIDLEPRPEVPVEPISIVDGDVLVFLNPGAATDGREWSGVSVGAHERQLRLDRDGAAGLFAYDLDGDGDLDLVSAARTDNNVQLAWFENPLNGGSRLSPEVPWRQWRVGSVRDAWAMDVADVTGDGRPDIVASGAAQMQIMLFVQPPSGPRREFDWSTYPIVTFENYEPRDVQIFDFDEDGVREVVCGATGGALRYFEPGPDPTQPWTPLAITTFDPPGDVGLLGYGDLDADGDIDLVAVLNSEVDNESRVMWVENGLR